MSVKGVRADSQNLKVKSLVTLTRSVSPRLFATLAIFFCRVSPGSGRIILSQSPCDAKSSPFRAVMIRFAKNKRRA